MAWVIDFSRGHPGIDAGEEARLLRKVVGNAPKYGYIKGMLCEAAYRYRFYPTQEQAEFLARTFGCVRVIYNRARAFREEAWTERKERVGFLQSNAMLTRLKKKPEFSWLNEVSSVCLLYTSRRG